MFQITQKAAPYIDLLRDNRNFRLLWWSQVVSNFGDWFGILAVYALIQQYSGSEFLLGLIIVVKMLSLALFSPLAGYITDRFNRRRLMVWCDILRGVIVLGFLLIVSAGTLWLAYLLTALQMMLSAIFQPAKTSSIPNVTSDDELVHANILSAASWSVIFTSGMALGGVATSFLGTDLVFVINSISYLYSGWVIWKAVVPQETMSPEERNRTRNPLTGIREGFDYLLSNRSVLRPVLAKGFMTSCLGALVYLLIIIAEEILLMGSMGLGLLYAARGIGTGIGPVMGRRLFRKESSWIRAMGFCMICCGVFYLPLAFSSSLWVMFGLVTIAHMASGANWVMSTVLLQRRSVDTYRGRAFSTEWLLFTLAQSVSVTFASLMLELDLLTVREATGLFALLLMVAGLFWLVRIAPAESSPVQPSGTESREAGANGLPYEALRE
ncbi:MAG: MFS transporter, partial [Balneolaceae bacterium]